MGAVNRGAKGSSIGANKFAPAPVADLYWTAMIKVEAFQKASNFSFLSSSAGFEVTGDTRTMQPGRVQAHVKFAQTKPKSLGASSTNSRPRRTGLSGREESLGVAVEFLHSRRARGRRRQ
jgi:hypothetical protein